MYYANVLVFFNIKCVIGNVHVKISCLHLTIGQCQQKYKYKQIHVLIVIIQNNTCDCSTKTYFKQGEG